jgi:hypothetical protein
MLVYDHARYLIMLVYDHARYLIRKSISCVSARDKMLNLFIMLHALSYAFIYLFFISLF